MSTGLERLRQISIEAQRKQESGTSTAAAKQDVADDSNDSVSKASNEPLLLNANDNSFITTNDVGIIPSNDKLLIPSNDEMSNHSNEAAPPSQKMPRKTRKDAVAQTDWRTDVLARAKSAADEDRSSLSRVNFETDPELHKRLKRYVVDNDTSIKKLLEALITEFLPEEEGGK